MINLFQLKVLVLHYDSASFVVSYPNEDIAANYEVLLESELIESIPNANAAAVPSQTNTFRVTQGGRDYVDVLIELSEDIEPNVEEKTVYVLMPPDVEKITVNVVNEEENAGKLSDNDGTEGSGEYTLTEPSKYAEETECDTDEDACENDVVTDSEKIDVTTEVFEFFEEAIYGEETDNNEEKKEKEKQDKKETTKKKARGRKSKKTNLDDEKLLKGS